MSEIFGVWLDKGQILIFCLFDFQKENRIRQFESLDENNAQSLRFGLVSSLMIRRCVWALLACFPFNSGKVPEFEDIE